jgi:dihydroorotase/N-acyl-D-amino-acid deacylase
LLLCVFAVKGFPEASLRYHIPLAIPHPGIPMKRFVLAAILLALSSLCSAQTYDVLIRNGKIVDGSGNPWFYGDVGLKDDKIVLVGAAPTGATSKQTIDARGLIVAPGFIDMLGHSEINLLIDRQAVSKLTQGVTTEITGEGVSVAPLNDEIVSWSKDFDEHFKVTRDWHTLDEYFKRLAKQGAGINLGTLVGATTVREMVLHQENRAPTAEELQRMQKLVEETMQQGAFGLGTSLIYAPANFASTEELIALAQAAAKYHGVYMSHIRNEGDQIQEALEEAFRIGREAHIPVEIWHLKVSGKQNWGRMPEVLRSINDARGRGLDVTANQYPYIASATSLGAIIPPRFHEGGNDQLVARLKDPARRHEIEQALQAESKGDENMWRGVGGPEGVLIASTIVPELKKYEGRNVAQVAQAEGKAPFDALCDLLIASKNGIGAIYFSMNETDMRLAMQQPFVGVGIDAGALNPEGPLGESKPHPRAYGSFTRILGKYVRDEHVLRLEDAIRKFTSLPAQRVHLDRRGLLRPGFYADITVFNPQTVRDVATFEQPNRTSEGIEYVFVNGVLSVEHGKVTGKVGGRPLRGPGYVAQ